MGVLHMANAGPTICASVIEIGKPMTVAKVSEVSMLASAGYFRVAIS
jgi:hypothetical protein